MSLNLSGLLLPITTPFTPNQEIDFAGLKKNLEAWNQVGLTGYVALGSTGERMHLDEREYVEVIAAVRATVSATHTFIAGAGQQSTRGTISEIKRAANAGADAVLVITPNFYRAAITPHALLEHYAAVADASPVPVILYSMPDLTGIKIEPDTAALLSQHQHIVGMKDSSNEIEKFAETVRVAHAGLAMAPCSPTLCERARREEFSPLAVRSLRCAWKSFALSTRVSSIMPRLCKTHLRPWPGPSRRPTVSAD